MNVIDVKIFLKKWKTRNHNTDYKNIQPRYRNRDWHWKMYHADNEIGEKEKNKTKQQNKTLITQVKNTLFYKLDKNRL